MHLKIKTIVAFGAFFCFCPPFRGTTPLRFTSASADFCGGCRSARGANRSLVNPPSSLLCKLSACPSKRAAAPCCTCACPEFTKLKTGMSPNPKNKKKTACSRFISPSSRSLSSAFLKLFLLDTYSNRMPSQYPIDLYRSYVETEIRRKCRKGKSVGFPRHL